MSEEHFLSRWSRLKKTAKASAPAEAQAPAAPADAVRGVPAPADAASATPAAASAPAALPPLEDLTPESDFAPFMRSGVAQAVRGQALRTLFQDPRFNVMDGLDTYIADYSLPDPLPPDWLGKMNQMARLGDYHEPEAEAQAEAASSSASAEQGQAGEQSAEPGQDPAEIGDIGAAQPDEQLAPVDTASGSVPASEGPESP